MINQETIDLLNNDARNMQESKELFKAVLASDKRDAHTLIDAIIASKRFPWVSFENKNCCAAVHHYYRGEHDYAKHAALSMLKPLNLVESR